MSVRCIVRAVLYTSFSLIDSAVLYTLHIIEVFVPLTAVARVYTYSQGMYPCAFISTQTTTLSLPSPPPRIDARADAIVFPTGGVRMPPTDTPFLIVFEAATEVAWIARTILSLSCSAEQPSPKSHPVQPGPRATLSNHACVYNTHRPVQPCSCWRHLIYEYAPPLSSVTGKANPSMFGFSPPPTFLTNQNLKQTTTLTPHNAIARSCT